MANESETVKVTDIEELQRRAAAEPGFNDFAALLSLSAEIDQTNAGDHAIASISMMWQGTNSNDVAT